MPPTDRRLDLLLDLLLELPDPPPAVAIAALARRPEDRWRLVALLEEQHALRRAIRRGS